MFYRLNAKEFGLSFITFEGRDTHHVVLDLIVNFVNQEETTKYYHETDRPYLSILLHRVRSTIDLYREFKYPIRVECVQASVRIVKIISSITELFYCL